MLFNKLTFAILPLFLAGNQAQHVTNAARAADFFPVSAVGAATGLVNGNGDTRIYYQSLDGGITQLCVSNAFATGGVTECNSTVVPAEEVLYGTPIAGTVVTAPNGAFNELHVFYLSPDHILSEWRWSSTVGARFGDACPGCVTHSGFQAVPGSQLLSFLSSSPEALVAQNVTNAARASNFFPVNIVGDAAAVANENRGTRNYYQPPGGGINQICTNEA
ncbi:hypothetical protein D9758_005443 [Tetrapyrgos nigripes]|uniref:Uncharacterized protein n=1 Tax=Tetrapyrgos nigripes TaxID=182062 RepID=A0A8H5GHT9_9AGAR|nr:hypothetical protein D9758_005443 [Tetrapyrgos nigripes]